MVEKKIFLKKIVHAVMLTEKSNLSPTCVAIILQKWPWISSLITVCERHCDVKTHALLLKENNNIDFYIEN
jgi:hypothetical protein